MVRQMIEVGKLGAMFAMYGSMYMLNPDSKMGLLMKKPFIKFVCHSSSYAFFLSKYTFSPVYNVKGCANDTGRMYSVMAGSIVVIRIFIFNLIYGLRKKRNEKLKSNLNALSYC